MTNVKPGQVVQHVSLPNKVTAGGEEQGMSYQQIMPLLHGLQPDQYTQAAEAFHELSSALETVRSQIAQTGDSLAANGSWTGTAAQAAMDQFQQLHDQAAQLSAQAAQTGNAVHWFGTEATPPFQQVKSPQVMSKTESDSIIGTAAGSVVPVPGMGTAAGAALGKMGIGPNGQGKADTAARGYMAAYNQQIEKLNNALPNPISGSGYGGRMGQSFRSPSQGNSGSGSAAGSGSDGVPGSGGVGSMPGHHASSASANPFARPASSSANPFASPGSANLPGARPSSHASLQGYTPPAGSTVNSPFAGGVPVNASGGGSANPFASTAILPGGSPGYRSSSGNAAGEDAAAEDALRAGKNGLTNDEEMPGGSAAEGAADDAADADAAKAAGAAGEGESGMPMGGMAGGGGQQDKERQRQAWMSEDTSIWGLPDEEIGSEIS